MTRVSDRMKRLLQQLKGLFRGRWTPDRMHNKVGWYDAATISGEAGACVTTWRNQWGKADLVRPAAEGGPTLYVTQGINVVPFDGVDDALVTATLRSPRVQVWLRKRK